MKNLHIPPDSDKLVKPAKPAKPVEPIEPTDQAELTEEKHKAIIREIGQEYWDLLEKMADE